MLLISLENFIFLKYFLFLKSNTVTTILITPTRTTVIAPSIIKYNTVVAFDTYNNLFGWNSDYNNYKWVQVNGNTSMFEGSYGPGSDYTSIRKFFEKTS
jgi:hypothetical protein